MIEPKGNGVASFIFDAGLAFVRIDGVCVIEILRADVQGLMDVADIVGKQNHGDGFRDLARVIFPDFAAEDTHAIGDHVHDVPLAAPGFAFRIFVRIQDRHVGVMEPMMRGHGRVGSPEFAQLLIDSGVIGVMRKSAQVVDPILVPGLDFVGHDGRFFERDAISQRINFFSRRCVCDDFVRDPPDDLMTGGTVGEQG